MLLYDSFLQLEEEVKYIWASKRSFLKWIYLVDKYVGTSVLLINTVCEQSMQRLHGQYADQHDSFEWIGRSVVKRREHTLLFFLSFASARCI
jgi:hypothetical protein